MLINIIFIIPYPELEEKVNKIFQNHPLRARLRKRIEMRTADELETFSFKAHAHIIPGLQILFLPHKVVLLLEKYEDT